MLSLRWTSNGLEPHQQKQMTWHHTLPVAWLVETNVVSPHGSRLLLALCPAAGCDVCEPWWLSVSYIQLQCDWLWKLGLFVQKFHVYQLLYEQTATQRGRRLEYCVPRHTVPSLGCIVHRKTFWESGSLTKHAVKLITVQSSLGGWVVILNLESVKSFDIHHSIWFWSPFFLCVCVWFFF